MNRSMTLAVATMIAFGGVGQAPADTVATLVNQSNHDVQLFLKWQNMPESNLITLAPGQAIHPTTTINGMPLALRFNSRPGQGVVEKRYQVITASNVPAGSAGPVTAFVRNDAGAIDVLLVSQGPGNNGVGLVGQSPQFPIKVGQKFGLGRAHHIRGDVTITADGKMVAKVNTWTKSALDGFTGSIWVGVLDEHGNLLWDGTSPGYGVNGEAVPGASSDRTDIWRETLPPGVARRARGVAIIGLTNPKGFLTRLQSTIREGNRAVDMIQQDGGLVLRLALAAAG